MMTLSSGVSGRMTPHNSNLILCQNTRIESKFSNLTSSNPSFSLPSINNLSFSRNSSFFHKMPNKFHSHPLRFNAFYHEQTRSSIKPPKSLSTPFNSSFSFVPSKLLTHSSSKRPFFFNKQTNFTVRSSSQREEEGSDERSFFQALPVGIRDEPDESWTQKGWKLETREKTRPVKSSVQSNPSKQNRNQNQNRNPNRMTQKSNQTKPFSFEAKNEPRFSKPKLSRKKLITEWVEASVEKDKEDAGSNEYSDYERKVNGDFNFNENSKRSFSQYSSTSPSDTYERSKNSFRKKTLQHNSSAGEGERRGEEKEAVEEEDDAFDVYGKSKGEIYIERFLERERSKRNNIWTKQREGMGDISLIKVGKEARRDEKNVPRIKIVKETRACCYGCGSVLQFQNEIAAGYVMEEDYETKKKHKQLQQLLCVRCQSLSQGLAVNSINEKQKNLISVEDLRANLNHLKHKKALIVKLIDIIDFNGSFISKIRSIVGGNPIILIITKIDLLPKGTNFDVLSDWITESIQRKKLNVISIHLISSKSKIGIDAISYSIQKEKQGRDVYVLGASNVGKSLFISAFLEEMSRKHLKALAAKKNKPISSFMPGTTLGNIKIDVFSNGGDLYDTPGVHLHHRMSSVLKSSDLMHLFPRNRLQGYTPSPSATSSPDPPRQHVQDPITLHGTDTSQKDSNLNSKADDDDDDGMDDDEYDPSPYLPDSRSINVNHGFDLIHPNGVEGYSFFWGGICRIDVIKANPFLNLTFYGSSSIQIYSVLTKDADKFYADEVGKSLVPPIFDNVEEWEGLPRTKQINLKSNRSSRPMGDITISGLGWISLSNNLHNVPLENYASENSAMEEDVELVVHVPRGVEVFLRPTMPVGRSALQWYEFADLADSEEASRPRVYYERSLRSEKRTGSSGKRKPGWGVEMSE